MGFFNLQQTGTPVAILDEGLTLTPQVSSINFVGSGVTGTAIGNLVTETIPGGGTTVWNTGVFIGDNSNKTFILPTPATSFGSLFLILNNAPLTDKNIKLSGYDYTLGVDLMTITMVTAPLTTDVFIYKYQ